jgi:competence ComEA-like helix-hairpin-helix protein
MKKNRVKDESSGRSVDQLPIKSSAENILVFLALAIFILAASFFPSHLQYLQNNNAPPLPEKVEKYVWLTGFPGMQEGLYLLTPEQLENYFPITAGIDGELGPPQETNQVIYAIQAGTDIFQPVSLPPAVANIFFQPIPINSANKSILTSLPGIGPALAEKIVQRRSQHGPFRSKEELLQISGIGPKKYGLLVDRITLD